MQEMVSDETMLIYRTAAPGSYGQCPNVDGTPIAEHYNIVEEHVLSLNAAARELLQRHPRWHLLDLEALIAEFDCPQEYLRDMMHISPDVAWTVLNIYVNMLHDFWEVHGRPSWHQKDREPTQALAESE